MTAVKAPGTGGRHEVTKDSYRELSLAKALSGALELLGIDLSLIEGATRRGAEYTSPNMRTRTVDSLIELSDGGFLILEFQSNVKRSDLS
ncbi:MAG: hypothetical protein LBO66_02960 [Deltaproteobacteria bacterium]|nr:hypothetical protein [Deltaproteobacteria bacterium]